MSANKDTNQWSWFLHAYMTYLWNHFPHARNWPVIYSLALLCYSSHLCINYQANGSMFSAQIEWYEYWYFFNLSSWNSSSLDECNNENTTQCSLFLHAYMTYLLNFLTLDIVLQCTVWLCFVDPVTCALPQGLPSTFVSLLDLSAILSRVEWVGILDFSDHVIT